MSRLLLSRSTLRWPPSLPVAASHRSKRHGLAKPLVASPGGCGGKDRGHCVVQDPQPGLLLGLRDGLLGIVLHQFLADWGDMLSQMDVDSISEHYARRGCFEFYNDYVRLINEGGRAYVRPVDMPWGGHSITANAQPFYVLLDNEGHPLTGSYSYDEDVAAYRNFLEKGLQEYRQRE